MTLKEAIEVAQTKGESKVAGVGDCGDRWAFGFEADKDQMDGWILLVDKESGDSEFVLPAFFAQSLESGAITYQLIDYLEDT